MHTPEISNENRYLGDLKSKVMLPAAGLGVVLIGLSFLKGNADWDRFWRAYIIAFCFVTSLSLGGLFFVMIQHLTRAGWSVSVRRIAEGLTLNLRWIWILFIPVLVAAWWSGDLFHWQHPEGDVILVGKEGYLNTTFWTVRAIAYFLIWAGMAHYFGSNSVKQDETGDPQLTLSMQKWAAPGVGIYFVTQSFAAIDWLMALEPHWFSTMFGVYFFAASCCGFYATFIITCKLLQRSGRVTESITTEHYQDLGKMLFAFGIVFWAYIGYSQYMLIWYANIPEETTWFLIRSIGGWGLLSLLLLVGHFFAPFAALMSRYPKRFSNVLLWAAVWMLLLHAVDVYWMGMPAVPEEALREAGTVAELKEMVGGDDGAYAAYDFDPRHFDLTLLLGMLSLFVAGTVWGLGEKCLVAQRDPRLNEAMAFENY